MKQKIKILHLEDVTSDAELINRELKKSKIDAEIFVVANKAEFIHELKNFSHDVILSDHSLASFNSHEALRLVNQAGVKVPFILVTATMTDEFAAKVMKEGACDYILKDRLHRLPAAIINSIENYCLEKEQQNAHERIAFHIENAPLGFIEWDQHGFAKTWSMRAEEIFGWSEKEFIDCQKKEFIAVCPEDQLWVAETFQQLINGAVKRNTMRFRNVTKDGKVIWCEWFNSVLTDKGGKVKTIMSLVQDISEQKQLESQKDNFISMVSHELKTPMTTIKAYGQIVESMLESKGDTNILNMVKRMSLQVNKLTALVQDLLDFTKVQKGKLIYHEAFYDFNELVKDAVDDMQQINVTHKIENHSGESAKIFGDKDKLSQVLNNLISNATKYSPNAEKVVITTELQKDGVELSVQDFGIGILAKDQDIVFEQFYRVNGENQSTFPGMGIGLFICAEIISRQGGRIWVNSTLGSGSTFHIWLPFDHSSSCVSVS